MKIKERIELRRKKRKEYWDNLDVDRELKIEKIKRSRDFRDVLGGCGFFLFLMSIFIPLLLMAACNLLTALTSKYYDVDNQIRILNELCIEDVNVSYAAYEDIVNDSNAIVNFNQLFKNSSSNTLSVNGITRTTTDYTYVISGTATANDYIWADVSGLYSSHKYYFNCYNDTITLRIQNFNDSITSPFIYTGQSQFTYAINFVSGQTYDITIKPILIDLSLMYGIGNEPNLEQCNNLFVASYYPYNTGSPVSFNTVDAYNNGVNSVLSATTFETITPADFYNNFTSYTYVPTGTDVIYSGLVYQDTGNWIKLQFNSLINTSDYSDYYACGYLPLTRSLIAGANCQISVYAYGDFGTGSTVNNYFNVCAVNSSGQVVVLAKSPILGTSNVFASTIDFSFDVPFAADYILIVPQRSGYNYYFKDFSINQRVINLDLLQETNYSNGYKEAEEKYSSILDQYASGGDRYNQILNYGKQLGREEAHTYTFGYLMTSVVEAPLNAILNLFNFDFLGYNMKDFVTLLLTMSVIIVVIRLFMGGKS